MTQINATGKYIKTKVTLFSTTVITYHGGGMPPPEFLELDQDLKWFQQPWGAVLLATASAALGAGAAKLLGWT
jgi:hypothetical protein